eukprot:2036045-Rhodomonas_salina.4
MQRTTALMQRTVRCAFDVRRAKLMRATVCSARYCVRRAVLMQRTACGVLLTQRTACAARGTDTAYCVCGARY